jgi:hypothetical protein
MLNTRSGTAAAGAASIVGVLLALAPVLGSSAVLAGVGLPIFAWGTYQLVFKGRNFPVRIAGVIGVVIVAASMAVLVTQRLVDPGTVEFLYNGSPLSTSKGSPLANTSFPPVTDDPVQGREFDSLFDAATLPVSCWVQGKYMNMGQLIWVSITDGKNRSLWVPLTDLGAMGRGAARTLLPCADWRWRIQNIP